MDVVRTLLDLVDDIRVHEPIEDRMLLVAERAAKLLDVSRVSVRLLDESRSQLLVVARVGAALHPEDASFRVGEGLVGWVAAEGLPLRLDIADQDPRYVPRAGMFSRLGSFLGAPLMDEGDCIGVLATSSANEFAFTLEQEQQLRLIGALVAPHLQNSRLRHIAETDPLTQALNRRGLDSSWARFKVVSQPLQSAEVTVAIADIDHFKDVNDRLGHAAGDDVLRVVADRLASVLRRGDDLVRLGGEEFLLILRGADLAAGLGVAERARQAVGREPITAHGSELSITISLGVAEQQTDEGRDELIDRADQALYLAKNAGRDRVVGWTPKPEPTT